MAICSGTEGGQGLLEADGTENMTRWYSRVTETSLICPDHNPSWQRTLKGAGVSHPVSDTPPPAPETQASRTEQARLCGQAILMGCWGEAEVSVRIRQQNLPALLPPLLFTVGFEAQGREQAPAQQNPTQVQAWD